MNAVRVPLVRRAFEAGRQESMATASSNAATADSVATGLLPSDGLASGTHSHRAGPLAGARILDVGCGGGILSEAMARLGADVTGLDAA
jgi:2-polyprenyl-3-methyl-5-hydroxy-6-metoxy-1,4-benzoquinol methylase